LENHKCNSSPIRKFFVNRTCHSHTKSLSSVCCATYT
jgi:hypothetical protein